MSFEFNSHLRKKTTLDYMVIEIVKIYRIFGSEMRANSVK